MANTDNDNNTDNTDNDNNLTNCWDNGPVRQLGQTVRGVNEKGA